MSPDGRNAAGRRKSSCKHTLEVSQVITSEKIKLDKLLKVLWIVVAAVLLITFLTTNADYSEYKAAQDYAVSILRETQEDFKNAPDGPETVREMYSHLQYYFHGVGYVYREVDKLIGEMLEEKGYTCYLASRYLEHTNYFEYTAANNAFAYLPFALVLLGTLLFTLWYKADSQKTMEVQEDCVVAYQKKTPVKQFLIKDIKNVEAAGKNGLKILGNGFHYKINLVKNREEIRQTLLTKLQSASAPAAPAQESAPKADDIRYFKDLLDSGIITQEEFDAKKKQLLGL